MQEVSLLEYKIRPVTRYVITRYERGPVIDDRCSASSDTRGEYDNADTAFDVAYALCKADHDRLGYPAFDDRIQYPRRLDDDQKLV